mmetsp:Transcript_36491/g.36091  ORF Transcript_36491/g.36091 Transcript_36491/m.36091 type:complete len:98 (+) Transcript_36491:153-446(+)
MAQSNRFARKSSQRPRRVTSPEKNFRYFDKRRNTRSPNQIQRFPLLKSPKTSLHNHKMSRPAESVINPNDSRLKIFKLYTTLNWHNSRISKKSDVYK